MPSLQTRSGPTSTRSAGASSMSSISRNFYLVLGPPSCWRLSDRLAPRCGPRSSKTCSPMTKDAAEAANDSEEVDSLINRRIAPPLPLLSCCPFHLTPLIVPLTRRDHPHRLVIVEEHSFDVHKEDALFHSTTCDYFLLCCKSMFERGRWRLQQ